jgi:hypothetical protein
VGSLFIFFEAVRIKVQLHYTALADATGNPPRGHDGWLYDSGALGFGLLLSGIVIAGIALFLEHRADAVLRVQPLASTAPHRWRKAVAPSITVINICLLVVSYTFFFDAAHLTYIALQGRGSPTASMHTTEDIAAPWAFRLTPDGALTATVLAVQILIIWRGYRLSLEAEKRSQRHDRVSVRPALEFTYQRNDGFFAIVLNNYGMGPAAIVRQTFVVDATSRSPGDTPGPADLLRTLLGTLGGHEVLTEVGEITPRTWMGAGTAHTCLKITSSHLTQAQVDALRNRVGIHVMYESLYGDQFESDSHSFMMRAV